MAVTPPPARPAWNAVAGRELIASRADLAAPLLPVLHALQDHYGHVPDAAVPLVADCLNLSRAEVHGVVTFYPYFRRRPPGRRTIRICRAEACQARQADRLIDYAKRRLGIDFHDTTPDGQFSLEPVYCLGCCACGPAIMVDDALHARVTIESFDDLVAGART